MRILKKMDVVIISTLAILSFTPQLIFSKSSDKDNLPTYAHIAVSGETYRNVMLCDKNEKDTITIKNDDHVNTILVENKTVKIIDANCKDSTCIKQGTISKVGDTLVCLPHKLIIEIKGEKSDNTSDLILSY